MKSTITSDRLKDHQFIRYLSILTEENAKSYNLRKSVIKSLATLHSRVPKQ